MINNSIDRYTAAPFDMTKVATVVLDDERKLDGTKKRQTEIRFVPQINNDQWKSRSNWCYVIAIGGNVEKIGGTASGLKDRMASYLCGTEAYRQAGTCATTNYICYQAMKTALETGVSVEIYALPLPVCSINVVAVGNTFSVEAPTYHAVEKFLLEEYQSVFGRRPSLSQKSGR